MSKFRAVCGPFFVFAGLMHFAVPEPYEAIVPSYLPLKRQLVYASGVAEAAGGLGLMVPATRRRSGWWLVATLLGIFPANIEMARHPDRYPIPAKALKARLPLQAGIIGWVLAAARR